MPSVGEKLRLYRGIMSGGNAGREARHERMVYHMRKNEQIDTIREAFRELSRLDLYDGFYNVVDRLYDMNTEQEKRHRRGTPAGCVNKLSVKDAAKLFVVKHMLDGHKEPDRFSVDDILAIRNEVLYAQAYAKKHHTELATWAAKWAEPFEQVDYAELMKGAQ